MLTIAKMHGESVAYYESTVTTFDDKISSPDDYYSEDGTQPATAWIQARTEAQATTVATALGVKNGAQVDGADVGQWFNHALAPSGHKLGRAPKNSGVPGFDLTFCAPKSVSLIWGLTDDTDVRSTVDLAHHRAVTTALSYLSEHAGYTRRADDHDRSAMIIDRVEALSGVRYEHRTSRAGDPHLHAHVLLANKQLCRDGKWRTLDGVSLYHEARAAGTIYQAVLREELSRTLGVQWADTVHGCAEIIGLDDRGLIEDFSTRAREIDQWAADNGVGSDAAFERMGQKKTRQVKDLDTPLSELEQNWKARVSETSAPQFVEALSPHSHSPQPVALPTVDEVLEAVTRERSTFTRADVVEAATELLPVGAVTAEQIYDTVEHLADQVCGGQVAWTVTPEKDRQVDRSAREGSQRFTSEAVVEEVNRGIDLATTVTGRGVSPSMIKPVEGQLSDAQAEAMRAVVSSRYLASVVIAPAGAGKTSSLKAARAAWEQAGKQVIGLAPTGKAADVMVGENVAHSSSTLARVLRGVEDQDVEQAVATLGWSTDHVIVVDEAGMVSTPEMVRVLELAHAADARVVLVGDPYQYGAVKARGGLLATLAHEVPDAVELREVFRQHDEKERAASKRLRTGVLPDVERAADFYAGAGRLHAGSVTAMLDDALAGWREDVAAGKDSLLVASTHDYVDALNRAAQQSMIAAGVVDGAEAIAVSSGQYAHVGDTILTRRNDYELTTSSGDVVRNGQRWQIEAIDGDGFVLARRLDDTAATVRLHPAYLAEHVQLGYASTGHAAQGATVDVARVVAGVGQIDRAGVYVPLTRGREANYLYMAESMPGDSETGHGVVTATQRRESAQYARDLLVQAATRSHSDHSPHEVHRQARLDWGLTRMSRNLPTGESPFRGTRMAQVADQRAAQRLERVQEFYATTNAAARVKQAAKETAQQRRSRKCTDTSASTSGVDQPFSADYLSMSPEELSETMHKQIHESAQRKKTPHEEERERLTAKIEHFEQEVSDLRDRVSELELVRRDADREITRATILVNKLDNRIRAKEIEREQRGFLAKAFKPREGLDQIEQLMIERDQQQIYRDQCEHKVADVKADLDQARTAYQAAQDKHVDAVQELSSVNLNPLLLHDGELNLAKMRHDHTAADDYDHTSSWEHLSHNDNGMDL
uniref:TraA protein n=1 Tax=Corynebacterium glutamicum TaxID=1718 RepID=Q8VVJ4_CORGT|nr:MobF family relaxase [Corynebacterium glutamicum]CAD12223.1 TraA protein [Corynebacterium glutamicum]